jgi:hypothetical protein
MNHVGNGFGIGGPIAELLDPSSSGDRIRAPEGQVQRFTRRSFETVSHCFQEGLFPGFLLVVSGTVTAA